eukprot:TRINITY_DN20682_c0_g1_i1.p1 TRINITY_DN20682_c0_g1~~TRINITY_DN20682_c0_g1_i1.p1  ORF type:complete len:463 (+),score=120.71 TRINITY_DN20682_c0_g1_i1:733-2121(+)
MLPSVTAENHLQMDLDDMLVVGEHTLSPSSGEELKADSSSVTSVATTICPQQRVQVLNLLPLTNKRKKNHVPTNRIRVACIPCKINKQKCDALRPCTRCVMKGKLHLCVDRASDSILSPDEPTALPVVTSNPEEVLAEVQQNKKTYRKRRKSSSSSSSSQPPQPPSASPPLRPNFPYSTTGAKRPKLEFFESQQLQLAASAGVDVFKNLFAYVLKPMYVAFAEKTSPFFIQDFIMERRHTWRRYITKMGAFMPKQEALALREFMIQSAASATADEESSQQMIQAFSEIQAYDFTKSVMERTEKFDIPEATWTVIEDIFHVKCLEDTDLAVAHSIQRVTEDGHVELFLYYNRNLERLVGRTVQSFGDQIGPNGEPTTPFIMRVMTNNSLQTVSKFLMAWILREESFFTDTVEIIRPDGSILRCFLAIIGGNEAEFEAGESSLVSIYKPCSVTFDPDAFKDDDM